MNATTCRLTATRIPTETLRRAVVTLNAELTASISTGSGRGTAADPGRIEMITAFSSELQYRDCLRVFYGNYN